MNAKWIGIDSLRTDYVLYNEKIYALLYENEKDSYTTITNIVTTDIEPNSLGEKTKSDGRNVFVTVRGEYSDYIDNKNGTFSIMEKDFTDIYNTSGELLNRKHGK